MVSRAPNVNAKIINFFGEILGSNLTNTTAEMASEKAVKETIRPEIKPRFVFIKDNIST